MEYEIYLRQFGYAAVFIGAMLEGETILFLAGLGASQGMLSIEWIILSAFLGTVAGDQPFFFIGRYKGRDFLAKRPKWRRRSEKVLKWIERHRWKVLFFYRFLYGFRGVAPFVFGLTDMPVLFFVSAATLVGLVWTVVMAELGYHLGQTLTNLGWAIEDVQIIMLITAVVGATLYYFLIVRRNGEKNGDAGL